MRCPTSPHRGPLGLGFERGGNPDSCSEMIIFWGGVKGVFSYMGRVALQGMEFFWGGKEKGGLGAFCQKSSPGLYLSLANFFLYSPKVFFCIFSFPTGFSYLYTHTHAPNFLYRTKDSRQ